MKLTETSKKEKTENIVKYSEISGKHTRIPYNVLFGYCPDCVKKRAGQINKNFKCKFFIMKRGVCDSFEEFPKGV